MTSACGLVFVPLQFLRPSPGFYIVYNTPSRAPPASTPVNVAAVSPVYTFLSTNSDVRIRLRTCDSYINYNEEYYIFRLPPSIPWSYLTGSKLSSRICLPGQLFSHSIGRHWLAVCAHAQSFLSPLLCILSEVLVVVCLAYSFLVLGTVLISLVPVR